LGEEMKIELDFFEFSLLVESCWRAGTILRACTMEKVINTWYFLLTPEERKRLYGYAIRTWTMSEDGLMHEYQRAFLARYNPDKQYTFDNFGTVEYLFELDGKYYKYWSSGKKISLDKVDNRLIKIETIS
jgi:hypothetical protein